MASVGGEQQISSNSPADEATRRDDSREGSAERKVIKDRDEKLKLARERQNEEKQRKIEELKAQAEAAQRYREQTEEKRRRRIEEIRLRDSEKRHQVEERKRAIMEADKERREYILKKNQERDCKLDTKRREKYSTGFAFGSSTPRNLELSDFGMVSPSTFLGQRRSTSISNVAGASLSRRSSERELADSGSKKRATSASGTDRHDDHRRKSSSMYEVLNWGYSNDEPPKRFSLSIVGSEINIGEPPSATARYAVNSNTINITNTNSTHRSYSNHLTATGNNSVHKEDNIDASQFVFRSVARRKTDLMPTIPSPREGHYGSKSSLSNTPRTPGRAYSMNRLDQLAQPIRRNGEHIRAILERERREQLELLDETESLGGGRRGGNRSKKSGSAGSVGGSSVASMSRSLTHLASTHNSHARAKYSLGGGISSSFRPLGSAGNRDSCKSMTQLTNSWSTSTAQQPRSNLGLQTSATKKYLQSSLASSASTTKRGGQQHITNPYRFDPNSLLLMNSTSALVTAGSRSGNVTPGGSINASRPGSAMSTSTTMSATGFVARRSVPAARKPRPASIAGTGVSLDELNKLKRDKPPMKTSTPITSTQTTPKRLSNIMSTSMIVTSSSSRLSSAEKKTPSKRDTPNSKSSTPKSLSKTSSFDRLNKLSKDSSKPKEKDIASSMIKSAVVMPAAPATDTKDTVPADIEKTNAVPPAKSKEEKNALNSIKTEEMIVELIPVESEVAVEQVISAKVSEEKTDQGSEKNDVQEMEVALEEKAANSTKENFVARELTPPARIPTAATVAAATEGMDLMSTSMMAKNKITTEEEAKAALAERRRLARVEAERQAELERQRLEAERLAELKQQEEEAERQRQFEEEATRLAVEQRRAEEERLRQAIEDAKQREEEERRKREEEEQQRLDREEADKKAKEEAEKQRLEVAERLKREEKEREERRKRVEAIMSRTRKAGSANTPNSTPVKENNESNNKIIANDALNEQETEAPTSTTTSTAALTSQPQQLVSVGSDSNSTSGSTTTTSTPTPILTQASGPAAEPQNSQAMYEQSVIDKENALIHSFSNMIIDENAKNRHQETQQQQPQILDVFNGKLHTELPNSDAVLLNSTAITTTVANGNGHIENINNKNDINLLQDVVMPATNQLIDLSIESQGINDAVNYNNNNSLMTTTTTTTLVTADSHENKDISLL